MMKGKTPAQAGGMAALGAGGRLPVALGRLGALFWKTPGESGNSGCFGAMPEMAELSGTWDFLRKHSDMQGLLLASAAGISKIEPNASFSSFIRRSGVERTNIHFNNITASTSNKQPLRDQGK